MQAKLILRTTFILFVLSGSSMLGFATPAFAVDPFSSLQVQVGYADNLRPSPFFPSPWDGGVGVTFHGTGPSYDSGAIRLVNIGLSPITVDSVTVAIDGKVIPNGNPAGPINLWGGPFTIPAGESAIFTQTIAAPTYNFDSSDTQPYLSPNCNPVASGTTPFPTITVTIGPNSKTYDDTAHLLDTGGRDLANCPPNTLESLQWRAIGTTGSECPSGQCARPVGGEIIPIDMTALLVAGAFTNAFWMVPALGGTGAALVLFKVKRKHNQTNS